MIPILILAAGTSSRMRGADKLLEDVDGAPLLQRQIVQAETLGGTVYVALPDHTGPRHAVVANTQATPLLVTTSAEGMGGTLRDATAKLPDCPAFMVILPDLATLTAADLAAVRDARAAYPDHLIWRGATSDGRAGHPIIFDASLRPNFADLKGDRGADLIARAHAPQTHLVSFPDDRARRDLDTPEDWAQWRRDTGR